MIDISTYLDGIAKDELGRDVLNEISLSLDSLNGGVDGLVDLTKELKTINEGRYGIDIRGAIHDALKKLSEAGVEPQPAEEANFIFSTFDTVKGSTLSGASYGTITNAEFIPDTECEFVGDTEWYEATSRTYSLAPSSDGLLLICFMHRCPDEEVTVEVKDELGNTVASSLVINGEVLAPDEEYAQHQSIFKVIARPNKLYTITVYTENSTYGWLEIAMLYSVSQIEVVQNILVPSAPTQPIEKGTKRRLYLLQNLFGNSSYISWTASGYDGLDLQKEEKMLYSLWYDHEPNVQVTPTFNFYWYSYNANTAGLITLDLS